MKPLPLDRADTILDCLNHYADLQPDSPAFIFLAGGEGDQIELSYRGLRQRALAVAALLSQHGLRGRTVLLKFPSGLEFITAFFGCLYAGAIAVPCNLARNSHHYTRLSQIIADSQAAAVLTSATLQQSVRDGLQASGTGSEGVAVLCEPPLEGEICATDFGRAAAGDLAFLQYTSGSTGQPKGVMISHGQLIANERAIQRAAALPEHVAGGGWLPQYHDMGLIGATLQPIALGGHYVFMSPLHFLQRPLRWLEMISRFRLQATAAPNFALELCARVPQESIRAGLDLSTLRTLFCGAEPVNAGTVERFNNHFAPFGLHGDTLKPCYGLAEATLIISGGSVDEARRTVTLHRHALAEGRVQFGAEQADEQQVVCCGKGIDGHHTLIVDGASQRVLGERELGEVWFAGPSVAGGYWRNGAATEATFGAHTACGQGPFLRTGDLGFIHDGGLYITGRIKELLIIRGRNYYPHDIEATMSGAMPLAADTQAVVFSCDEGQAAAVVAYVEVPRRLGASTELRALAATLRQAVAESHELQLKDLFFVMPRTIPRTSSGKPQRHRCAALYQSGEIDTAATTLFSTRRRAAIAEQELVT